jgi:hypothetical protein
MINYAVPMFGQTEGNTSGMTEHHEHENPDEHLDNEAADGQTADQANHKDQQETAA